MTRAASLFASLDIGSNTVRLLIAEKNRHRGFRPLCLERKITRLGGNFSLQGCLAPESIARTVEAIAEFASAMRREKIESSFAVATGVVRAARNGEAFLKLVEERTGIRPRLISGQEEARFTLEGVMWSLTDEVRSSLLMDIGGWSTEILWVEDRKLKKAVSTDLGAVFLAEKFFRSDPPGSGEIELLDARVDETLEEVLRDFRGAGWGKGKLVFPLVGTAGTITTLAAIDLALPVYEPQRVNHHLLCREKVKEIFSRLASQRAAARRLVPGLEEGREDLILSGTRVVLRVMEHFGAETMMVIDSGLLEGVLLEGIKEENLKD